jgi:hypothetical protein
MAEITAESAIKAVHEFVSSKDWDWEAWGKHCQMMAITPSNFLFRDEGECKNGRSQVDQADNRYV